MVASELLQSKFDKVKSFIDSDSFLFTFSKSKPFAIHKDQLFKNQIYNTYTNSNGIEVNERINSNNFKKEKIEKIISYASFTFILFDSKRLIKIKNNNTYKEIDYVENIKDIEKGPNDYNYLFILGKNNTIYLEYGLDAEGEIVEPLDGFHHFPLSLESKTPIKNIYFDTYDNILYVKTIENDLLAYNIQFGDYKYLTNIIIDGADDVKHISKIDHGIILFDDGRCKKITLDVDTENDSYNFEITEYQIEDFSVGLKHTIFLTKTGEVIGIGSNDRGQLGDKYVDSKKVTSISYGDIRFRAIKASPYGTILLSEDGRLFVTGTFINGEFGQYNNYTPITLEDENEYARSFVTKKLLSISRIKVSEDGEYKLKRIF